MYRRLDRGEVIQAKDEMWLPAYHLGPGWVEVSEDNIGDQVTGLPVRRLLELDNPGGNNEQQKGKESKGVSPTHDGGRACSGDTQSLQESEVGIRSWLTFGKRSIKNAQTRGVD